MSGGPLERLTQAAEEAIGDDPRPATFIRGLAIGALVGAAIAGSTIWQRRHNRLARLAAGPATDSVEAPPAADSEQASSG